MKKYGNAPNKPWFLDLIKKAIQDKIKIVEKYSKAFALHLNYLICGYLMQMAAPI